jgi:hypothetical protein
MRYSTDDFFKIHQAAVNAADQLKTSESQLIVCLQRVDESRTYSHMNYDSLYRYALTELKLSEDQAYVFKQVARKAAQLPELQQAILAGEITVSKAKRVMRVINQENAGTWIEMLKTKSKREIEKAVATESPRAAVQEKAKYVSADILEYTFAISAENLAKIKHAQDLLSRKMGRAATMEEILVSSVEVFTHKYDPVEKARRAKARSEASSKTRCETRSENHAKASETMTSPDIKHEKLKDPPTQTPPANPSVGFGPTSERRDLWECEVGGYPPYNRGVERRGHNGGESHYALSGAPPDFASLN